VYNSESISQINIIDITYTLYTTLTLVAWRIFSRMRRGTGRQYLNGTSPILPLTSAFT